MKKQSKKEFLEEKSWKRIRVHLNKQGMKDMDVLFKKLKLHSQSATVRQAMRLAVNYLTVRDQEIEDIKTRIRDYTIKDWELYVR